MKIQVEMETRMKTTYLCKQIRLAIQNLDSAVKRIKSAKRTLYSKSQVSEITTILPCTFWKAMPYFVQGMTQNPIHHNTQVVDNMVQLALGEKLVYSELKNAVLLALLHDIGNAVSQRQKFKTDQVIAALKENARKGADMASKAIASRLEHMDNGPELARGVLDTLVAKGQLGDEDVHFLCRAIAVHDYPSIEKILQDLEDATKKRAGYAPGDFLLPFDSSRFGKLIEWLREADRLFMLSEQGVIKDVRDSLDADAEPTAEALLEKLESNAEKHAKEFELYEHAGRAGGFQKKTLYRTKTGYALFTKFMRDGRARWRQ
jgi:hypothetical protein